MMGQAYKLRVWELKRKSRRMENLRSVWATWQGTTPNIKKRRGQGRKERKTHVEVCHKCTWRDRRKRLPRTSIFNLN